MRKQFWVIGAQYGDLEFTQPVNGTACVHGPFGSYQEANHVWRERAMESRHEALTRYTIVADLAQAAAGQSASAG